MSSPLTKDRLIIGTTPKKKLSVFERSPEPKGFITNGAALEDEDDVKFDNYGYDDDDSSDDATYVPRRMDPKQSIYGRIKVHVDTKRIELLYEEQMLMSWFKKHYAEKESKVKIDIIGSDGLKIPKPNANPLIRNLAGLDVKYLDVTLSKPRDDSFSVYGEHDFSANHKRSFGRTMPSYLSGKRSSISRDESSYYSNKSSSSYYTSSYTNDDGYVGLSNQGATCYLNSLLQTLYNTPEFRLASFDQYVESTFVEKLKAAGDIEEDENIDISDAKYSARFENFRHQKETNTIPRQLQMLFVKLNLGESRSISTTDLTKSFGWTSIDAFTQHDVQELCRVLFDALDNVWKGTTQENLISDLYEGELRDFVRCLECDYESKRADTYLDIPLVIKGFGETRAISSIEEALDKFVTVERLDENNKYFCERCDKKVIADKGLAFESFPYILTFHLKRFDYDLNYGRRIKLNDKVTFPKILDMGKYIEGNGEDCKYELYSVMVHSGSALGGHYYAYIKSFRNSNWYKFNDSSVTKIDYSDVKTAYGGSSGISSSGANAYMLIYRKIDDKSNRIEPTKEEVPEKLISELRDVKPDPVYVKQKTVKLIPTILRKSEAKTITYSENISIEELHELIKKELENPDFTCLITTNAKFSTVSRVKKIRDVSDYVFPCFKDIEGSLSVLVSIKAGVPSVAVINPPPSTKKLKAILETSLKKNIELYHILYGDVKNAINTAMVPKVLWIGVEAKQFAEKWLAKKQLKLVKKGSKEQVIWFDTSEKVLALRKKVSELFNLPVDNFTMKIKPEYTASRILYDDESIIETLSSSYSNDQYKIKIAPGKALKKGEVKVSLVYKYIAESKVVDTPIGKLPLLKTLTTPEILECIKDNTHIIENEHIKKEIDESEIDDLALLNRDKLCEYEDTPLIHEVKIALCRLSYRAKTIEPGFFYVREYIPEKYELGPIQFCVLPMDRAYLYKHLHSISKLDDISFLSAQIDNISHTLLKSNWKRLSKEAPDNLKISISRHIYGNVILYKSTNAEEIIPTTQQKLEFDKKYKTKSQLPTYSIREQGLSIKQKDVDV